MVYFMCAMFILNQYMVEAFGLFPMVNGNGYFIWLFYMVYLNGYS